MRASLRPSFRCLPALVACGILAALAVAIAPPARAQEPDGIRPVTDAELQNPDPDDWLMWRRTLDGWGYSPLDRIDRGNVGESRSTTRIRSSVIGRTGSSCGRRGGTSPPSTRSRSTTSVSSSTSSWNAAAAGSR